MKKLVTTFLILAIIFAFTAATATAEPARNVTATVDPGITITLNGVSQGLRNAQGESVYPILYGGSTYLPLRAIASLLGVQVDWHPDGFQWATGRIIHLQRGGQAQSFPATQSQSTRQVQATIDPGVRIFFDGAIEIMRDANRNQVHPLMFEGTTYLPVRAVAEILDLSINWVAATRTVQITI